MRAQNADVWDGEVSSAKADSIVGGGSLNFKNKNHTKRESDRTRFSVAGIFKIKNNYIIII
eukprot:SAG25_NODE_1309_length_3337_cov_1.817480_4_plen_61_part_00